MGSKGNRLGEGHQSAEVQPTAGSPIPVSQDRGVLAERVVRNGEPREQLVTVEEAARLLACTPAAIRKWLAQRRLNRVKLGSLTRLKLTDVQRIAVEGLPPRRGLPRGL
jgi:excisionase family DNA binding protein